MPELSTETITMTHSTLLTLVLAAAAAVVSTAAWAKLPPPSDEAKAKAAEAAAKTAHGDKVGGFQLCKSQDKVAAHYVAWAKTAGKETKPATATPACADPGPFVYPLPAAAPAAPTAATASPAAPAAPAAKPAGK
jgi:hypothetical protein